MTLNFLVVFSHRIRHAFKYVCMLTWMYSGHWDIFQEWERLNGQSFVQILLLNVLFDELVIDGFPFNVGSTEEHSGSKVILIVDDVHGVKSDIFLFYFFFLVPMQYNNFITFLCGHGFFIATKCVADSFFADGFDMNEVLFLLVEIFGSEIWIWGGFPCPASTNLT